jgi:7-alpha-hydroxysteroid dehydrogenase
LPTIKNSTFGSPTSSYRADGIAAAFESQYLDYQYIFVEFLIGHMVDAVSAFDGDYQEMLVLAVLGQARLGAVRAFAKQDSTVLDMEADTESTNASRIADITKIPRQTVRRKLQSLEARGWIERNEVGAYRLVSSGGKSTARRDLAETDRPGNSSCRAAGRGSSDRHRKARTPDRREPIRARRSTLLKMSTYIIYKHLRSPVSNRSRTAEIYMFDPKAFQLEGQVALVTGAGAGIGRGIAEMFAGAGASVVVSDLKQETADDVANGIVDAGGKAVGLGCNVTKEADLAAAVQAAIDNFGSLTILVNNAGGGGPKPFDMPMEDFRWAYELNVFAPFRLTQLAAPHMEAAGGGSVLNISSMSAENKNLRMASYSSSKAAISHLTRNIAFDLGAKNIRVNAIAPGAIRRRRCPPC